MISNPSRTIRGRTIRARGYGLFAFILLAAVAAQALSQTLQQTDGGTSDTDPPLNIVLFVTDDESPTLGCYGDPVAVTPHIDRMAGEGVLFKNAFATTASCSASRSVILSGVHNHLTGQYGHQHHFHKFSCYRDLASLSLPLLLQRQGYLTAQIGKYHVAPEEVFHFEFYLRGNSRNPVAMANQCRSFVAAAARRQQPFFLYFATSDPHRGGGPDPRSELELAPDLFGNKPAGAYEGVAPVRYQPGEVPVPAFLPDTPETREELANYYQSCSRVDQGLGRLIEVLQDEGVYDRTLIVFTSDHGMAFAGAKTTVYEPGLRVPFIVRDPRARQAGRVSEALVSHVDIAPSLLDYAGGLDQAANQPRNWQPAESILNVEARTRPAQETLASELGITGLRAVPRENHAGGNQFRRFHGNSWRPLVRGQRERHHEVIFASHTFHEIQMYYPMRVVRDENYKLIWNIAHPVDYPFASDLWAASSWQAQYTRGREANYGTRTVAEFIRRPEFELFRIDQDPHETKNLALDPEYEPVLRRYQERLAEMQRELQDPWVIKWKYE